MWRTWLTAPRSRLATVAISVVVALVVLLLAGMFYVWVIGTQLRPMP